MIAHKSDVGGVVLGVTDAAGLRAAVDAIRTAVGSRAPVDQVLVQTMAHGLGEALVGVRRDEHAGPIVVLAAGGLLAELYRDRSVRTAPVDLPTARAMIAEMVAFPATYGLPQRPPRRSRGTRARRGRDLRTGGRAATVLEAEVNPLLILPEGEGVVAVDALVRRVAVHAMTVARRWREMRCELRNSATVPLRAAIDDAIVDWFGVAIGGSSSVAARAIAAGMSPLTGASRVVGTHERAARRWRL